MDKQYLQEYLKTRRQGWPYEDSYSVEHMDGHRFIARIGDELAGLSYAEVNEAGTEALMKLNLKGQYAEFGIGTELLSLLMDDLQRSGFRIIRYVIARERYAFQIYKNLGLSIESQDADTISFISQHI